jgi:hypothetical protein
MTFNFAGVVEPKIEKIVQMRAEIYLIMQTQMNVNIKYRSEEPYANASEI